MKKILIIIGVLILTFSIPAYTLAESDKSVEQEKDTKSDKVEKKDKKKKKSKKKSDSKKSTKKKKKRNPAKEKETLEKCIDKTILDAQKVVDKYHYECRILNYEGNDYTSFMSYFSDEDKEKWTVIAVSEIDTVKKTVTMSIDSQQEQEERQKAVEEEQRRLKQVAAQQAQAEDHSFTVYITNTGSKYHVKGCQYLKSIKEEMTEQEALNRNYEPCSRCILKH